MTDKKKGITITTYLGHTDSPRAKQLLGDIEQYATRHGITHMDKPALGKAVKRILQQFFATDARRLEAGLTVACAECGRDVPPGSGWVEYQGGGVCCEDCQRKYPF